MSDSRPPATTPELPSVRRKMLVLVAGCIVPLLLLFLAGVTWHGDRAMLFIAAVVVVCGTLATAWRVATQFSDSVELFCAAVRATGDADIWLPPPGTLEELHLGQAFRYAAARLRDAHDALRRHEAFLETVLQTAREAIVTSDEEGFIVLFNRAAEEMFGLPAEDAIGTPLDRLVPHAVRREHLDLMRAMNPLDRNPRAMAHSRVVDAMHAAGHAFPVTASISCGGDGERRFYTAILRPADAAVDISLPR